jgi:hypothetical protein
MILSILNYLLTLPVGTLSYLGTVFAYLWLVAACKRGPHA